MKLNAEQTGLVGKSLFAFVYSKSPAFLASL